MTSLVNPVARPAGRPSLSQDALLDAAVARVRAARPDLAARLDPADARALHAVRAGLAATADADPAEVLAVVVIGRLDLAAWVRDTCGLALALDAAAGAAWRRSFTRTVFLAGSPPNLRERFAFDRVAEDATVAWAGPAPRAATATLRRLLKSFEAPHELPAGPAVTVTVPGRPPGRPARRVVRVATARVPVAEALVHVNHLLTEAVLDGLVGPGDRLALRFVPRLTGDRFLALRVDTDVHRPDRLQAYAGLTEEV
ncbi:DUF6182 family protein [Streptomyces sp. DSM 44915]|uniref:DUF6182 family protein n=1 Tax=Streptomyces chisholmiae TaxID=3075540 RepID=A0ABU2JW72_9ACTN|nr:DUF6182 family protein [Streptomyces sp. DSM 44915]MDT0269245.1 DUF6182 family protein [Streptomyces sp. DSM 44915]